MKVITLFTQNSYRNFNYLIVGSNGIVFCLDPWDADLIDAELKKRDLKLDFIINTHEHGDHTRGNEELKKRWQCQIMAHENANGKIRLVDRFLKKDEIIKIDEESYLKVLDTPGHTFAHLCLLLFKKDIPYGVFTGDTLFNAGVGNCYNGGDAEVLYETIKNQIKDLPDHVIIFPGHEYLENNLKFTLNFLPENKEAKKLLNLSSSINWNQDTFTTTMLEERKINTFLMTENVDLRDKLDLPDESEKEVFLTLRKLRDKW